jgi:hypothetical protein
MVLATAGRALHRRHRAPRRRADLDQRRGCIPLTDLGRLLDLAAVDVPSRNNQLVRTLAWAEQFGLAFTSLGVPGEQVTFGLHEQFALVPARLLERLAEVAKPRHLVAVEAANEALTGAGLPALRSALPAPDRSSGRPPSEVGRRRPTRCPACAARRSTRYPRSPASTPKRRSRRRRRPSSRCDPDATAHVASHEPPMRSRRTPLTATHPLTRLASRHMFRYSERRTGIESDNATHPCRFTSR